MMDKFITDYEKGAKAARKAIMLYLKSFGNTVPRKYQAEEMSEDLEQGWRDYAYVVYMQVSDLKEHDI